MFLGNVVANFGRSILALSSKNRFVGQLAAVYRKTAGYFPVVGVVARRRLSLSDHRQGPVSIRGIFGEQRHTGTDFSASTAVFPFQYHSTCPPY